VKKKTPIKVVKANVIPMGTERANNIMKAIIIIAANMALC
jgi:hypothetical protein